jgi:hypothetical protein
MAAKVINGHTHIRLVKSCSMMRGQLRAISFLVKHSSKHTIPRDPSDGGRRRRRRRRRRCNAAAAPKSATAKRTAARSPSGPWTTPGRSGGATDGPALSGGALPQRHSSASNGQPAVDPVHASIQPSMLILARQKGKPSMCLVWTKKFGASQRATQKFLSFSFPSVASLNFDCEFR